MKDRRIIEELTIEELEEVLRIRKREARLERLRQMGKDADASTFDPLAPRPAVEPQPVPLPTDHRRFQEEGATTIVSSAAFAEGPLQTVATATPSKIMIPTLLRFSDAARHISWASIVTVLLMRM